MNGPHPFDSDLPEPTALEETALRWVARCDAGLTPIQQAEFDRWVAADPQHLAKFEEYDGTWALLDRMPEVPPKEARRDSRLSAPHRTLWGVLAAAAAIALVYVGWWRPQHYSDALVTRIGDTRSIALPDGSEIQLNTDSGVSVSFSPDRRRVTLVRGEVHFNVAKDAARPFVVEANGVAIRAVGTAFKVRLHSGAVDVLVTEGRVRVARSGESEAPSVGMPMSHEAPSALPTPELQAGQRARVSLRQEPTAAAAPEAEIAAVSPAQIKRELSWQERRLEFSDATLAEIVAEFNRYNTRRLVVQDSALASMRFGGSFQSNDPARFVRMLTDNFPVKVVENEGERVLRLAP